MFLISASVETRTDIHQRILGIFTTMKKAKESLFHHLGKDTIYNVVIDHADTYIIDMSRKDSISVFNYKIQYIPSDKILPYISL